MLSVRWEIHFTIRCESFLATSSTVGFVDPAALAGQEPTQSQSYITAIASRIVIDQPICDGLGSLGSFVYGSGPTRTVR